MLAQHDTSHRAGADVVTGHMPLHQTSPRSFLSEGVRVWADSRARVLGAPEAKLTPFDLLTGQLSVKRDAFHAVGGFDPSFTDGGEFGDEDLDFGLRAMEAGYCAVFNPKAVTRQRYLVSFGHYLKQWRDTGRADVQFARKHPEHAVTLMDLRSVDAPLQRFLLKPLAASPLGSGVAVLTAKLATASARRWPRSKWAGLFFFAASRSGYWSSVAKSGGFPARNNLRVLSYHSISAEPAHGELDEYVIRPDDLDRQLSLLKRKGYTFVSPRRSLAYLEGRGTLPRRAVLVSFDDGYKDFAETAVPVLQEHDVVPLVFVVTAMLGQTNEWDRTAGGPSRNLLNLDELLKLRNVEIGSHSRHHVDLVSASSEILTDEVDGSLLDLDEAGLNRLRMFCFPYGERDRRAREQVRKAGVKAAFGVHAGIAKRDRDVFDIPRIEILRSDGSGERFAWKVRTGAMRLTPVTWKASLGRLAGMRSPSTRS